LKEPDGNNDGHRYNKGKDYVHVSLSRLSVSFSGVFIGIKSRQAGCSNLLETPAVTDPAGAP
jgi:hypothetical protein